MAETEEKSYILIVEDDQNIAELIQLYLTSHGYAVKIDADGAAVEEHLQSGQVQLVILDLLLPRRSGWEICRKIRGRGDTPVIILTAKGDLRDKLLGFELGADDYIVKPFDPLELVARVKAVLRRSGERAARDAVSAAGAGANAAGAAAGGAASNEAGGAARVAGAGANVPGGTAAGAVAPGGTAVGTAAGDAVSAAGAADDPRAGPAGKAAPGAAGEIKDGGAGKTAFRPADGTPGGKNSAAGGGAVDGALPGTGSGDPGGAAVNLPGLRVDLGAYEVLAAGEKIELTRRETELLYFLAAHPNRVFTREYLLKELWGYDYLGGTRTVDVHINRLRDKIEKPGLPWQIKTVWGVGYKFEID